jgi:hypothetical protein
LTKDLRRDYLKQLSVLIRPFQPRIKKETFFQDDQMIGQNNPFLKSS